MCVLIILCTWTYEESRWANIFQLWSTDRCRLTLQRRHECCPSRLQETPTMRRDKGWSPHSSVKKVKCRLSHSQHKLPRSYLRTHFLSLLLSLLTTSYEWHHEGKVNDSHLYVSAWRTWQLAWCSNWSSSQRKFWQKEQRKIRPPIRERKTAGRWSLSRYSDTDVTWWVIGWGSHHDPIRYVHTQCSPRPSGDTHRRGCSNISDCGTPKLHRSHTLPPCGKEKSLQQKSEIAIFGFLLTL